MKSKSVALLLYAHRPTANAPTIMEHVNSFERYSDFNVVKVNTDLGYPAALKYYQFEIIIFHYSLFGNFPFRLSNKYINFLLTQEESLKVAFFQDEYQYGPARFKFINVIGIDVIYTLLEERYFDQVYYSHTNIKKVFTTLTGYVDKELVKKADTHCIPFSHRDIDIGYRARELPYWMGKGAQEKTDIVNNFISLSEGLNLWLDLKPGNKDRIYGDKWYHFIANCRYMLGVEAGVSIFDLEDKVRPRVIKLLDKDPDISFEEIYKAVLYKYENNIYYRTISPRIFEMAALRVTMILYEGKYQGILKPFVHYIPLKKDLSNFSDVIKYIQDEELALRLAENAYNDLIASTNYTYTRFIKKFDSEIKPFMSAVRVKHVDAQSLSDALERFNRRKLFWLNIKSILYKDWPGKSFVKIALQFSGLIK